MSNNLRALRKAKGLTLQQLGEMIGVDGAQISRMERGTAAMTVARVRQLGEALGVPGADIIAEDLVMPPANATPVPMEGASAARMREDLPIFGTALGAPKIVAGEAIEQTTLNTGEIVQYARRPVILDGRADAYGLYVQGHSMEPVHLAGDLVLAERKRPARIGDDVVVYLRPDNEEDDGERARGVLLKRLVRRTATYIELEQFNAAATFRLELSQIVRIDRVMRLTDLIA